MTPAGRLDPDAHRRVTDLFHQALELPPADRTRFVRAACPDSPLIADEVLSLIAVHEKDDQFLNAPLPDSARQLALAADAALERVGQTIGQYRIDGILGQGGMGVVYQAFDQRLNIIVALKAISPDVTRDPVRRERLRREAQVVARLKHPGIAWVYALEEFDEDLFIAGEFIEGETLRDEIGRGPADAAVVLDTAIQLAGALAAAHDQGVIHRDLKPENVMRDLQGRIRILDFGLAQMRHLPPGHAKHLTEAGKLFGTPAYMSPEQLLHESLDGRSDLFSLGILLYELLTGVHPFDTGETSGTMSAIRTKEPRPFRSASGAKPSSGSITPGLENIIRTLLRKTPAARYASAHQLHATLERLRAGDRSAAFAGVQTEAVRWWKTHQVATCAFYLGLLIPTWIARSWQNGLIGPWYFVAAIVAVVSAITLRWHLWFAAFSMPAEFAHQYQSNWKWVRGADLVLVAAAEASGFAILRLNPEVSGHSVVAVILIVGGVLALLGSFVIEPATTRAAFGQE